MNFLKIAFNNKTWNGKERKRKKVHHHRTRTHSKKKRRNENHVIKGDPLCENESPSEYEYGGYHPVKIGDTYAQNYVVVGKLGWGAFSTVWLTYDKAFEEFVALKIIKSSKEFSESAKDEIKLCKSLQGCQGCVQMFDKFYIEGPNGRHICMVFELAGDNLLSLIRKYQTKESPMPFELIKQIFRDCLTGIYEMQKRKMIHTDLKPENILLTRPTQRVKKMVKDYVKPEYKIDRDGTIRKKRGKRPTINPLKIQKMQFKDSYVCKLADFGNACWTHKKFSELIQSRNYRAPEVILGQSYSLSADIWSLGCILFELCTFDVLFDPRRKKGKYSKDEDHLAQMIEILGPMPVNFCTRGKYSAEYFDEDGNLLNPEFEKNEQVDIESVLIEKYRIDEEEAKYISHFMHQMLQFDPTKRGTPEELLNHPWLTGRKLIVDEDGFREDESFDDKVDFWENKDHSQEHFFQYYRDYY